MNPAMNTALVATVSAAVAGLIAWFSGLAAAMWPPHPILGALLITVFTGIVVHTLWPAINRKING